MADVKVGGHRNFRSGRTRDPPKEPADNRITRSRSRGVTAKSSIVADRIKQDSFKDYSVSKRASKRKLAVENGKNNLQDLSDSKRNKKKARKESNVKRNRKQDDSPAISGRQDEVKGPITSSKRSTQKVVYSERNLSGTSSDSGSDNASESETEMCMLSSDSSQSTHQESDSPIPTSELSDSSKNADTHSDDSAGSEVLVKRQRASPRKMAQARSRKKIAELCNDGSSEASSESSYSEDL